MNTPNALPPSPSPSHKHSPINTNKVLLFNYDYQCNLDRNTKTCAPSLSVHRLDASASSSPGYNFRYAKYAPLPDKPGHSVRELNKAYGMRWVAWKESRGGGYYGRCAGS